MTRSPAAKPTLHKLPSPDPPTAPLLTSGLRPRVTLWNSSISSFTICGEAGKKAGDMPIDNWLVDRDFGHHGRHARCKVQPERPTMSTPTNHVAGLDLAFPQPSSSPSPRLTFFRSATISWRPACMDTRAA